MAEKTSVTDQLPDKITEKADIEALLTQIQKIILERTGVDADSPDLPFVRTAFGNEYFLMTQPVEDITVVGDQANYLRAVRTVGYEGDASRLVYVFAQRTTGDGELEFVSFEKEGEKMCLSYRRQENEPGIAPYVRGPYQELLITTARRGSHFGGQASPLIGSGWAPRADRGEQVFIEIEGKSFDGLSTKWQRPKKVADLLKRAIAVFPEKGKD